MSGIAARLRDVRAKIERTLVECGRPPDSVRLIAVSKTKSAADIREAYEAGQRDFGENYVKELELKAEELTDLPELRFHLIGHLQRNKAKIASRLVSAIHTIDSLRLAEELGKRAAEPRPVRGSIPPSSKRAEPLSVLVEVNVGGEAQKSGCAPDDLGAVLDAIEALSALRLVGLMTVPPYTESAAGARPFFDALGKLRDEHGGAARLPELSMGMSHDVEQAIHAGATMVRVGRAIFGERG
ncbi:MAG TPA: YggS family pyridoxal phosphate-dependent enzyme [Polyangiaceae bacterium]|nr:YggS family pyridoxal phosphate-dependent enzyme [Polyangiaceae bacterium]